MNALKYVALRVDVIGQPKQVSPLPAGCNSWCQGFKAACEAEGPREVASEAGEGKSKAEA